MPAHAHITRPTILLTPATQSSFVVRSACSPVAGTDVMVIVAAGVVLSGTVTTGTTWPADCTITFVVLGVIGGAGGFGRSAVTNSDGLVGLNGSHGVVINGNVRTFFRIQAAGFIAGGGGGGACGASDSTTIGSGPGGGGQGYPGGTAGTRHATDGTSATDGTNSAPGTGGSGGGMPRANFGGDGGGLAGAGHRGGATAGHTYAEGGNPGAAIYSVGFPPPVIYEGNDSAHIKGLVTTI
jgi:Phage tail fibre adhesin Gp38